MNFLNLFTYLNFNKKKKINLLKLSNDIFHIISSKLNFNNLLKLKKTDKQIYDIIKNNFFYIEKKKIYASNLIKLSWLNYKYIDKKCPDIKRTKYGKNNISLKTDNYKLCTITENTQDPDFGYSMNGWLVIYQEIENNKLNAAIYECYGDSWDDTIIVKIHPYTLKQYPFIIEDAKKLNLSATDMVLDMNDLIFLDNENKNIIKQILKKNI